MKQPLITDSAIRGRVSSKLVWNLFADRPWVLSVRETIQNSREDAEGYDMFAKTVDLFGTVLKIGGDEFVLPIQIKSSDRSVREFFYKHLKQKRFFNQEERKHQFILCGMEEFDVVLADVVGQLVAHGASFKIKEKSVLGFLKDIGDIEAAEAYKRNKILLMFRWYGNRLPPL